MSDIESTNWSETAASNTAASPNGWPSNSAPTIVYSTDREMMGAIKREWNRAHPTVTSGGSANVQTLTYTTAPASYIQGQKFCFIAGFTNTGTATLNVNALGAKNVFMDGVALAGGEIVANSVVMVVYDGTQFQIISSRALGSQIVKNWLINGGMEIWQRGAGGSASISVAASSAGYTADRWVLTTGANEACTVSQQPNLTNGSRFCARVQRNSGQTGTSTISFEQPLTVDQVYALRSSIVTISCSARSGANWSPTSGALTFGLNVGTGASEARNASLTGLTQPATVTTNLGTSSSVTAISATSASVVAANASQGSLIFTFTPTGTAGANDYVEIDDVAITITPVATAFERRRFDEDLAACQPFFQKSFNYTVAPAQSAGTNGVFAVWLPTGASGTFGGTVLFTGRMHGGVSITTYNPSASNANWRDATNSADRTVSSGNGGDHSIALSGASGVAGSQNIIHWTADADI